MRGRVARLLSRMLWFRQHRKLPRVVVVGRDDEIALVREALVHAVGGRNLFVLGKPGMGKTEMLAEAGRLARDQGWVVAPRTLLKDPLSVEDLVQMVENDRVRTGEQLEAVREAVRKTGRGLSQRDITVRGIAGVEGELTVHRKEVGPVADPAYHIARNVERMAQMASEQG